MSPTTDYVHAHIRKHRNDSCLHKITAVIFHTYMVAEYQTPKKTIYLHYILFILIVYPKVVIDIIFLILKTTKTVTTI